MGGKMAEKKVSSTKASTTTKKVVAAKKTAKTATKADEKTKTSSKVATTKTTAKAVAPKAEAVKATATKVAATKTTTKKATAKKEEVAVYDESSIQHLEGLEHIRLRPGMYIGSLGDGSNENDGIYILLKEGIDNSIDEFSQGFGSRIDVEIKDGRVKIRDYGRGIPLGKLE